MSDIIVIEVTSPNITEVDVVASPVIAVIESNSGSQGNPGRAGDPGTPGTPGTDGKEGDPGLPGSNATVSSDAVGVEVVNGVIELTTGYIIPTLTNFNSKVNKVNGKDLSTNDFTDEYKDKIDSIGVGEVVPGNTYDELVVHKTGNESIAGHKTFTDEMLVTAPVSIGTEGFDTTNPEQLKVDMGDLSSVNVISGYGNYDKYMQLNIKNKNSGEDASSDLVATADVGQEGANYVDTGINSSGYNDPSFGVAGALDAYSYTDGNYAVGTSGNGKELRLFVGGTLASDIKVVVDETSMTSVVPVTAPNLYNKTQVLAMSIALGG